MTCSRVNMAYSTGDAEQKTTANSLIWRHLSCCLIFMTMIQSLKQGCRLRVSETDCTTETKHKKGLSHPTFLDRFSVSLPE